MKRLILINGKGGAGKTTVAEQLFRTLPKAALLDIDDVMRVKPWEYNDDLIALGVRNAVLLINSFFGYKYDSVILSGGIHQQKWLDGLLSHFDNDMQTVFVWLTANQDVRNKRRLARARDDADQEQHFAFIDSLFSDVDTLAVKNGVFLKIDTSAINPAEAVWQIGAVLNR